MSTFANRQPAFKHFGNHLTCAFRALRAFFAWFLLAFSEFPIHDDRFDPDPNLLPEGDNSRIELTQGKVADEDFAGVSHGWEKHYWAPWRN